LENYYYYDNMNNPSTVLFKTIETAETNMLRNNQWAEVEAAYSKVINTSSMIQSIVAGRYGGECPRLKLEDWNGALVDVDTCLQLHHHHHESTTATTASKQPRMGLDGPMSMPRNNVTAVPPRSRMKRE